MAENAPQRKGVFERIGKHQQRHTRSGQRPGSHRFRERSPYNRRASRFSLNARPLGDSDDRFGHRFSYDRESVSDEPYPEASVSARPRKDDAAIRGNMFRRTGGPRERSKSPESSVIAVRGHAVGRDWDSRTGRHGENRDQQALPGHRNISEELGSRHPERRTSLRYEGGDWDRQEYHGRKRFRSIEEDEDFERVSDRKRSGCRSDKHGRGDLCVEDDTRFGERRERNYSRFFKERKSSWDSRSAALPRHHGSSPSNMRDSARGISARNGTEVEEEWKCLKCNLRNYLRRERCRSCGTMRNAVSAVDAGAEAVQAAQWCSASGIVPQPANFETDPASGWKFDPVTRYYVISEEGLVFYDGVGGKYLKFDCKARAYVPCEPPVVQDGPGAKNSDAMTKKETTVIEGESGAVDKNAVELGQGDDKGEESGLRLAIVAPASMRRARGVHQRAVAKGVSFAGRKSTAKKSKDKDRAVELALEMGFLVCRPCRVYFKRERGLERHIAKSSLHRSNTVPKGSESTWLLD